MEGSFSLFFTLLLGGALSWGYRAIRLGSFHQKALSIIQQAERVAHDIQEEKKAELLKLASLHETKIREENTALEKEKQTLKQEKKAFKQEADGIKKEIVALERSKKAFAEKERSLFEAQDEAQKVLESISKLTFEEAKRELWRRVEAESSKEQEKKLVEWQAIFDHECQARASSLLFSALERKTQALTKDTFLTELLIPEKTISKLIGKQGRNIQTLEEVLGVLLLIDETENKVRISAHDPKRRMLAKTTLERVLSEDKVTPVTIRTAYEATCTSLPKILEEKGREACKKVKIHENLHANVFKTLGELSLRSSAGQNVLLHSIEVAELMENLAKELGLYAEKAKIMGLFHDIGKALSPEWGTTHALAGSKFLETHGIEENIFRGIASHHGEVEISSNEARLLPICDRLSAQLPGARKDQDPFFLSLVHQCEEIAKNSPSILSAWAHYAGNHVEVVVRIDPQSSATTTLPQLEALFASHQLRLPVKISVLNEFDSSIWPF
jgi:ribonucrease Y